MPFRHDAATRRRAVALVRSGVGVRAAAAAVGAAPSTVYAWLHAQAPELVAHAVARCWRCRPDLPVDAGAYAHLLGLYLGDGWSGRTARGSWTLSIACCDDYPGLMDECEESMRRVLAESVWRRRRNGCHDLVSQAVHWSCVLPQHGPGRKHARRIVLEPWQRELVAVQPGRLLRGLFHSDGWRGTNVAVHRREDAVVRYRCPRYEFCNHSDDIRRICTDALDQLAIAWRANGPWRVSVSRRAAVAALDEHVGEKH